MPQARYDFMFFDTHVFDSYFDTGHARHECTYLLVDGKGRQELASGTGLV
jgi:hypothetical protein